MTSAEVKHQWEIKYLSDCLLFMSRGVAPSYVSDSPIAALNQKAIRWGYIEKRYLKYHDPVVKVKQDVFIRQGDIVVNSTGDITIGRAYYFNKPWPNLFADSHVTILRLNSDILLPEFCIYLFPLPEYQNRIYSLVTGATGQLELSKSNLSKLEVVVPPLPTQSKIASILSAYDDLIENNLRRIKILEEMAQTIYREWFVKFRFPACAEASADRPGHKKFKIVDSPLGKIPEGWEVKPLQSLISEHIGGGWGKETLDIKHTEPAWVIRGTDIPDARHCNISNVPHRYHALSNLRSRQLTPGDIIFEVSGGSKGQPLGRTLYISSELLSAFAGERVICASFCKRIKPDVRLYAAEILYLSFLEAYNSGEIEKFQVQSTGISNFKWREYIQKTYRYIPPDAIQARFNELVDPLFSQIATLGLKNRNLRQTRDLLLPKLISGEVDVSDLDIKTDEPD